MWKFSLLIVIKYPFGMFVDFKGAFDYQSWSSVLFKFEWVWLPGISSKGKHELLGELTSMVECLAYWDDVLILIDGNSRLKLEQRDTEHISSLMRGLIKAVSRSQRINPLWWYWKAIYIVDHRLNQTEYGWNTERKWHTGESQLRRVCPCASKLKVRLTKLVRIDVWWGVNRV